MGLELSHRLHFGQEDPLDERAQRQIPLRVNTRGHADSLKELRLKDACRHAFQCHSDIVFSDEGFIQSPGWIRKAEVC
ncbi:MAG: hypothetical protein AUI47_11530 [Acidobacteria bacterium 13_1_40CM_2_68_5]|nr:MAG: hypothetical protein AUI47_11530 [Acidobacteria bacterium 13_1_40CM_2_68_5]OLE66916.1 MAG: hypothetical protein AUG09_05060 [Acidobacteria bacterium 13_1_20CM_2_68_7]